MTSAGEMNATIAQIKRYVAFLAQAIGATRRQSGIAGAPELGREHGVGA